uniref:Putative secreted protein n=1 Tax=Rhipicephalus microplus TaxID=6941 RepID=A0A6G5A3S6_RHIMP
MIKSHRKLVLLLGKLIHLLSTENLGKIAYLTCISIIAISISRPDSWRSELLCQPCSSTQLNIYSLKVYVQGRTWARVKHNYVHLISTHFSDWILLKVPLGFPVCLVGFHFLY